MVNAHGKRISRAVTVGGKRQQLTLCRLIFKLDEGSPWPPPQDMLHAGPAPAAAPKGKKGAKKVKKWGAAAPTVPEATAVSDVSVAGGRKVLSEEVQVTKGSVFELEAVREPLAQSGRYGAPRCLSVSMLPQYITKSSAVRSEDGACWSSIRNDCQAFHPT